MGNVPDLLFSHYCQPKLKPVDLLIASSGKITLDGGLSALEGIGDDASHDGGSGAGGVIHLIANTIDGTGDISATYMSKL